jgi:hypothetical protein
MTDPPDEFTDKTLALPQTDISTGSVSISFGDWLAALNSVAS